MFSRDGSCGTNLILNKHKTTYGQRYLAMQTIARLTRQKILRLTSLPEEEVVDFNAIKFEMYKVLKLGGGASSREAHSRLCTRTSRSCNIFLRYQSYKEGIHPDEDSDSNLRYNDLLTGQLTFPGADRQNHIQVGAHYSLFFV